MLTLFGLSTVGFGGCVGLRHALEDSRRCGTCSRTVTVHNYQRNILTVRKVEEDEESDGSEAAPPTNVWPAAFGPTLLRGDIVQMLFDEGITGFVPRNLTLEIKDYPELPEPAPAYFFLEIAGRFDVRILNGDVRVCPECKSRTDQLFRELIYLPIPELWDGSDLCEIGNVLTLGVYCSRKFIEMARRRRLDFFEFGRHIPNVPVRFLEREDWHRDVYQQVKAKYPQLFSSETDR